MPTPVVSIRARPEDARWIRQIASRLRDDPGFRLVLEALVPPPVLKRSRRGRRVPNRGSFSSEAAALAAVVDRLVATHRPLAVWLFGSRATGTARVDSDFDLLLVMRDGEDLSPDRAYAPLLGLGVGCDVVPCRLSDFEEDARIPGTLCHEARTHGRRLYQAVP